MAILGNYAVPSGYGNSYYDWSKVEYPDYEKQFGTTTSQSGSGAQYGTTQQTTYAGNDLIKMLQQYGGTTPPQTTGTARGVTQSTAQPRLTSSTTSTTAIKPSGALPSFSMPELALPEYDEAALTGLTQKIASPIIRSQRQLAERSLSRHYDNPNVAKLVSGEIMRQFGTNLAESLSGARRTAANEYVQKLTLDRQKVMAEQQVKQQAALTNYQAALQDYFQQYGSSSTTSYKYTYGMGE